MLYDVAARLLNVLPVVFFFFTFICRRDLIKDAEKHLKGTMCEMKKQRKLNTTLASKFTELGLRIHYNEYAGFFIELLLFGVVTLLAVFVVVALTATVVYFGMLAVVVSYGIISTHTENEENVKRSLWLAFSLSASILVYSLFLGSELLSFLKLSEEVSSLIPSGVTFGVTLALLVKNDIGLPRPLSLEEG